MGVEHAKQTDLFPLPPELLCSLKRDEAPSRVSDEIIRAGGLHGPHRANIMVAISTISVEVLRMFGCKP